MGTRFLQLSRFLVLDGLSFTTDISPSAEQTCSPRLSRNTLCELHKAGDDKIFNASSLDVVAVLLCTVR